MDPSTEIRAAILSAFRENEFDTFLQDDLKFTRSDYVKDGAFFYVVSEVLEHYRRQGELSRLIAAVAKVRPRNVEIQRVAQKYGTPTGTNSSARRSSSLPYVNSLPMIAPEYFQDRAPETERVKKFLADDAQRLLVVYGRPGIGKTALVCRVLRAVQENGTVEDVGQGVEFRGLVYLSAVGSHHVTWPNFFHDLCELLEKSEPKRAEELRPLFRARWGDAKARAMAMLEFFTDGRFVVLMDNLQGEAAGDKFTVPDADLIGTLQGFLETSHHGVKIIVTTRHRLDDLLHCQPGRQARLELDKGLSRDDSEKLMREMDPQTNEVLNTVAAGLLDQVYKWTHGTPKALENLATILATDRTTSLPDILDRLEGRAMDQVMETLVSGLFEQLDDDARTVAQAAAVFPRPTDAKAVTAILAPRFTEEQVRRLLNRLTTLRFVQVEQDVRGDTVRRYYLLPMDRRYVLTQLSEQAPHGSSGDVSWNGLRLRAADHLRSIRPPRERWKRNEVQDSLIDELDLRYAAEQYETAAELLLSAGEPFFRWGLQKVAAEWHEKLDDKVTGVLRRRCVVSHATALFYLGRFQESVNLFRTAADEIGDQDLLAVAVCHAHMANCQFYLADIVSAQQHAEQALRQVAGLDRSRPDVARVLMLASARLGACLSFTGDATAGLAAVEEAIALARSISDRNSENLFLDWKGVFLGFLGRWEPAKSQYETALRIAEELSDRYGMATHLCNMAELAISMGDYAAAVESATRSLKVGFANTALGSWANMELALAHLCDGDLPNARAAAEQACSHDVPLNQFIAQGIRGVVCFRQGERDEARRAFATAIELADEMLRRTPRHVFPFDIKGLALSGLVLCGEPDRLAEATEAYRSARTATREAGHVRRALKMYEELARADPGKLLPEKLPLGN